MTHFAFFLTQLFGNFKKSSNFALDNEIKKAKAFNNNNLIKFTTYE